VFAVSMELLQRHTNQLISKNNSHSYLSGHVKNQTLTEQIFVNILVGSFYQSLLTCSKLTQCRTVVTRIL
jgi:hypothetical protein